MHNLQRAILAPGFLGKSERTSQTRVRFEMIPTIIAMRYIICFEPFPSFHLISLLLHADINPSMMFKARVDWSLEHYFI